MILYIYESLGVKGYRVQFEVFMKRGWVATMQVGSTSRFSEKFHSYCYIGSTNLLFVHTLEYANPLCWPDLRWPFLRTNSPKGGWPIEKGMFKHSRWTFGASITLLLGFAQVNRIESQSTFHWESIANFVVKCLVCLGIRVNDPKWKVRKVSLGKATEFHLFLTFGPLYTFDE